MKKTLLLGSFAVLGMMANAQTVTTIADGTFMQSVGFVEGEKVTVAAGTVFAEGEAGTIAVAYEDSWGMSAPAGGYKNVIVGDSEEFKLSQGGVGNTNPTFVNYASGVMTAGAVFEIVPASDGWLTVFTKMNPNKQYVVFEGKTGPMSYTLGYSNGTDKIHYTLPADADYYIDFSAPDASTYFIPAGGEGPEEVKPQMPWIAAGLAAQPSDNTGFVTFNVIGGNTYYFCALGSKCPCGVIALTPGDEMPSVTYLETEELPEVTFEGQGGVTAVEGIAVAPVKENNAIYNLMGQKVNADAKGLLIQNGKKVIRR